MWDVVVIGAGLAGLTAGRHLHRNGYRTLIMEKSRGLGGRLATRRVDDQPIDHGCRFLTPFEQTDSALINQLLQAGVITSWRADRYHLTASGDLRARGDNTTYYVAPQGMTAVAKFLAAELPVYRSCRVTRLRLTGQTWTVQWDNALGQTETAEARSVIAAIPAPQILPVLSHSGQYSSMEPLLQPLSGVGFDPVITVMAGYPLEQAPVPGLRAAAAGGANSTNTGWMVFSDGHTTLRWVGLDSSKRLHPHQAVVVIHSTPDFAADFLDQRELSAAGQALLDAASAALGAALTRPTWQQSHRWRYGFVSHPYHEHYLSHHAVPGFIGCGDWCLGPNVEAAFCSGQKAAEAVTQYLA
jgi:renalase